MGVGLVAAFLAVLIGVVGYAVWQVVRLGAGIQRSDILAGQSESGSGEEVNLLLMGLDSRLDMNGKALSADLYDKLHSGDASDGGMNANVLMYVHIPADGSKAVAFSIPRDDYVDLPGCPDKQCKSKIKEAYGLTFDQESRRLAAKGVSGDALHQQSRDAARKAQIATVEKFLDVKINHFVEVTMIAFFEIAEVVQPVTVCVKQPTVDTYSGADFTAGPQQIDAAQAVAFVRQRRDTSNPSLMFTDLDRSRRQQAFIVSLLTQLKSSATFTNPSKISGIIDVAKRNTAIDSGLDPLTLVKTAQAMQGGKLHFYTLPIEEFGTTPGGAAVNIVDTSKIRSMVKDLISPPAAAAPSKSPPAASPTPTIDGAGLQIDAVNASGRAGAAKQIIEALAAKGFRAGFAGNGSQQAVSEVAYAVGARAEGERLGAYLGNLTVREDSSLAPGTLKVTIGASFTPPPGLFPDGAGSGSAGGSPSPSASATAPVDATGGGTSGPPPTALTELAGEGVPCVK
ncbi:MAG: LCP family protein [Tetrasphaera sp.]|nr:LCP family protein [Tetrasphaera sp.]